MAAPKKEERRPSVLMTETERKVNAMMAASGRDFPSIESVEDLATRIEMRVPPEIKQARPEFGYKWLAVTNRKDLVSNGGIWKIVNRENHGHLDSGLFDDAAGAILYNGQNVLAFTKRELGERIQKIVVDAFNQKVEASVDDLEASFNGPDGRPVATVYRDEGSEAKQIGRASDLVESGYEDFDAPA